MTTTTEDQRASARSALSARADWPDITEPDGVAHRIQLAAACLALAFVAFIQSPGLIWSDSKLDLATDPWGFLAKTWHLWDPLTGAGQLQNQAYGYLFPMGPWFAFWDAMGLPTWMAQRGWMAALLVLGFLGVVRLCEVLDLGSPWTRMVAAFAFTLAPRLLTIIGPISSEALPMVFLPWCLVPLARCARGDISSRRAAALYGLAVLCMGGVNATATIAVLVVPALFLMTRAWSRTTLALIGWSTLATILATAWWLLPLVVLGRYSFPFLDYVETAAATTSRTSLVEVLRGTTHWVGYLRVDGQPWWQAAEPLVTNPVIVVETALLAGVGLAGMTRRSLPHRRFIVLSALVGIAGVTLGHLGPFTPPWGLTVQNALDGALAPFRNVHKFDPVIRLSLALAMAHWLTVVVVAKARATAVGLCALLLLGAASPALTGRLGPAGAFTSIPSYWPQAADWLAAQDPTSRTLMLPGDGFGQFTWGRTVDEAIQPDAGAPWWVRQQAAALPGTGGTRLLDSIEAVVDRGDPAPGLADLLARSGVRFILVRNDLAWATTGAPRPSVVAATLEQSPGLRKVATFGPISGGEAAGSAVLDTGLGQARSALEIYEVTRAVSPAVTQDLTDAAVLSGGPENLLDLVGQGIVGADQPVILASDPVVGTLSDPEGVITDGLARRSMTFGSIRDNTSETYTPDHAFTVPTPDLAPVVSGSLLPGELAGHTSTATFPGLADIRASTSASDPTAALERDVSRAPFAALDGVARTAWLSGQITRGGQWWEVDFAGSIEPSVALHVVIARSSLNPERVSRIRVSTDAGSLDTPVSGNGAAVLLVPQGPTTSLRIEAVRFGDDAVTRGMFGLSRVSLADLGIAEVARSIVSPDDQPTSEQGAATVALSGGQDRSDGCVVISRAPRCSEALQRTGQEAGLFDRTLVLGQGGTYTLGVVARPAQGAPAAESVAARDSWSTQVDASTTLVRGAGSSAAAAHDGDLSTSWQASRDDRAATLSFGWPVAHAITGVRLVVAGDAMVSVPTRVRVTVGDRSVEAWLTPLVAAPPGSGVGAGGGVLEARFPALTGKDLDITVVDQIGRGDLDPGDGGLRRLPVGASEVMVLDRAGRVVGSPSSLSTVPASVGAALSCGFASVDLDGQQIPLEGSQPLAARVRGSTVRIQPCDQNSSVRLAPGYHRIVWSGGGDYEVVGLSLRPAATSSSIGGAGGTGGARSTTVEEWTSDHRTVSVAAGPAAVLVVHENPNAGWSATVDGRPLEPLVVDGWQQGWRLPSSGPVQVTLDYTPTRTYRAALALGAVAVLGLLVLAGWPSRGRPRRPGVGEANGRAATVLAVAVAVILLVEIGGPWGLLPAAIGCALAQRHPQRRDVLVLSLCGASGCIAAATLIWVTPWPKAVQGLTQPALLAALGAAVAVLLPRYPGSRVDVGEPEPALDVPPRTS